MASRHSPTHLVEGARDTAQCQRASRPQDMCLATQRRLRGRSGLGPGTAVGRLAQLGEAVAQLPLSGKNEAELWRSCGSASSIPSPSSPHGGPPADCWRPSLSYFPLLSSLEFESQSRVAVGFLARDVQRVLGGRNSGRTSAGVESDAFEHVAPTLLVRLSGAVLEIGDFDATRPPPHASRTVLAKGK